MHVPGTDVEDRCLPARHMTIKVRLEVAGVDGSAYDLVAVAPSHLAREEHVSL